MIAGNADALRIGGEGIGAVAAFNGGNDIFRKLARKIGGDLDLLGEGQKLNEAVRWIVGRRDDNERVKLAVFDHVVEQALEIGRLFGIEIVFRFPAGSME